LRFLVGLLAFAIPVLGAALIALWLQPDYGSIKSFERRDLILHQHDSTSLRSGILAHTSPQKANSQSIFIAAHGGKIDVRSNGRRADNLVPATDRKINRYLSHYFGLLDSKGQVSIAESGNIIQTPMLGVYTGPAQVLRRVAHQQVNVLHISHQLLPGVSAVALLLSAFLVFFSKSPLKYFLFIALTCIQIVIEWSGRISLFGHPFEDFISYAGLSQLLAAFMLVSVWTNGPHQERSRAFWIALMLLAGLLSGDILFGIDAPQTVAFRILAYVAPGLAVAIFAFRRLITRMRDGSWTLVIVFGLVSSAFAFLIANMIRLYAAPDIASVIFLTLFVKWGYMFELIGLLTVVLHHEARNYFAEVDRNTALESLVSGKNVEVNRQAEALKLEIERRAVLEERQRFTRDMHDGIGGQLLSMLLKARSGTISHEEMQADLAESLNDLRLMSAALNGSDDGLVISLEAFHSRLAAQASSAGLILDWQVDPEAESISLGSSGTLDLLRIIQEAMTNVVRHASARQISVTFQLDQNSGQLLVTITDDGVGLRAENRRESGSGLSNMEFRARRLGGDLRMNSGPDERGTMISVSVPAPTRLLSRTD
jgi:signal transduction histidine kinase